MKISHFVQVQTQIQDDIMNRVFIYETKLLVFLRLFNSIY
jgi:hypothetical protein